MPQPVRPDPYEHARDVATAAALEAGHLIRAQAGRVSDVREKGKHDLVTEIDEEAQRIILRRLKADFPDYDVLAEEGTDLGAIEPISEGYRWIIDPIDGTTNFLHGVPPYAVSIGLQHGADVVVGVVLDVARGELFTAVRGGGLYVDGVRKRVSAAVTLKDSLLSTGFPYRSFGHVDIYLQATRRFMHETQAVRRHGAASMNLAYVACGRFDGFFELGLWPWDVAAGLLLVEEGGGRVTDFRDAPNPVFARQLVASNGQIHSAMLDVLESMRDVYR